MTVGRKCSNGNGEAKLDSSEIGLRSLEKTRLLPWPIGSLEQSRRCRDSYRVSTVSPPIGLSAPPLAAGFCSISLVKSSQMWFPWLRLNPPKMAPFFAAPNKSPGTMEADVP